MWRKNMVRRFFDLFVNPPLFTAIHSIWGIFRNSELSGRQNFETSVANFYEFTKVLIQNYNFYNFYISKSKKRNDAFIQK